MSKNLSDSKMAFIKELKSAVKQNDFPKVEELLSPVTDSEMDDILQAQGREGQERDTILHQACITGNLEILEYLLKRGGRTLEVDKSLVDTRNGGRKDSLLHEAAYHGNLTCLEFLVENGADINSKSSTKETPLHQATIRKNLSIVKYLLSKGAEVNSRNVSGITPLHFAAEEGYLHITKCLLHHGADLNIQSTYGNTSLHEAVSNERHDIVQYMLQHGNINFDLKNRRKETAEQSAIASRSKEVIEVFENHFVQPIFKAIEDGNIEELKSLMNPDNIRRNNKGLGKTALFNAVSQCNQDAEAVVEFLCSVEGLDVNKGDPLGVPPLTEAVRKNKADIIQILLQHPEININRRSKQGGTALSEAVKLENGNMLKMLCKEERLEVSHKDWESAERQNEMFESPVFYPLLVRMAIQGCQKFELTKSNGHGDTLLLMAVLADQDKAINCLYKEEAVNFSAKNHDGETAFDLIFPSGKHLEKLKFKSIVQIAHRYGGKTIITRKDDNQRTVLHLALELLNEEDSKADGDGDKNIEKIILFFLAQPGLEIDIYHKDKENKQGIFYIFKDIVSKKVTKKKEMDVILRNYLSERIVPGKTINDIPWTLEKLFETANDRESILDDIRRKINNEECVSEVKSIYAALLNIIITGLQLYANHRRLQYIFYKGSVFKTFVEIFVNFCNEGSHNFESDYLEQLLRILYVSTQANIKCDFVAGKQSDSVKIDNVGSKNAVKSSGQSNALSRHLLGILGKELHGKFSDHISGIAKTDQKEGKVSDVQLIAKGIYDANFLKAKLEDGWLHNIHNDARTAYGRFRSWIGFDKFFHKCFCRGDFAVLFCFTSIFVQSSDVLSDALVGLKTLNGFSERLGILMIALVLVTLVHENISSVISAYDTDIELLRITLGKIDLSPNDYTEMSELNYYFDYNFVLKGLARFFWTFKVRVNTPKQNSISKKALIFNILSILMLRPVVDRLIVLTHSPSHLRAIFRQRSKQMSLNQYYMILEQIPELLIQFYVFQIFFNNLRTSDEYENYECTNLHSFSYKTEYFECVQNLMKLKICASWLEIYSMVVPFIKIPSSMVSLEDMFRTLHPETPNMSSATSWSLYFAYTLMIPSRLFLFAAVMHSAPNHLYVAAYIGMVTCVWLAMNVCTTIRQANLTTGKKTFVAGKKGHVTLGFFFKKTWSLLLFTVRDVVVISLRRPDAYLMSPSEVKYRTIRSWKTVLKISSYFFVEGVVGAWYVEHYYPCGRNTKIFKYQGWVYLILLILSITTISLVSYILQPTKINIIVKQYPNRAGMFCLIGFAMWSITVVAFLFTTTNSIAYVRLPLLIITLTLLFIMLSIVVLLRLFSEAKQKGSKEKDPGPNKMSTDESLHGPRAQLTHNLCCKQKEDSYEEPDEVRFALPLRTSNQYKRIAVNTADIQSDTNLTDTEMNTTPADIFV